MMSARIMVSYLQANDVVATLLDGEMSTMASVVGGVRIAVAEEQEPKARQLLLDKGVDLDDPS